jgi:hypothetical protein
MRKTKAIVQKRSGRMANGFGYTPGISKNMNMRGFVVMAKKKSDTMTKINPRVNGLRSSWYVLIYIYSNGITRIIFSVESIILTGKNGPAQFFIGNNDPPLPKNGPVCRMKCTSIHPTMITRIAGINNKTIRFLSMFFS